MARILIKQTWFDEISPTSFYESEFEEILIQKAQHIFPHFIIVPFKKVVMSELGSAKPDLALVQENYRTWWVVEVELSEHPLGSHVLPQVEILARAVYSESEAEYLARQSSLLDIQLLLDMMKGVPPKILVVVNELVPDWTEKLKRFDAQLMSVRVFRSLSTNEQIVSTDGEYPHPELKNLSTCRIHPLLQTTLVVDSPAALGIRPGHKMLIRFEDKLTEWQRLDLKNAIWLQFCGKHNPLIPRTEYMISRDSDGTLSISHRA